MLLTSREQKLIQAFIKKSGTALTVTEMLDVTKTSRRTLYRDLDKLQASLPIDVSLRTTDAGYLLVGNLSELSRAHKLIEFTAVERRYGELLLLIEERASIASLTENFGISQPTATNDLRIIEKNLNENGLKLDRVRGLKIMGNERNIRSVLASSLYSVSEISEILMGNFSENKVLSFLNLEKFNQAKNVFDQVELPEMTDKTRALMQIFLTTVFLRLTKGKFVSIDNQREPSKNSLKFVRQLLTKLSTQDFTTIEVIYLAAVYDVLFFGFDREVLFMEKFDSDFSYKIRSLIDEVSTQLRIEFSRDDQLYGLLYAHLKETDILPELFSDKQNNFVEKIEVDNQEIFKVVEIALLNIFGRKFSSMETAFITLHFVATLERSDLVLPLRTALVTSRGRISCEFLISNLRKNYPFLKKIDIIQSSVNFDKTHYDVIFTTEKGSDYIYINHTIEQKNLDDIRRKLRVIQQSRVPINSSDPPSGKKFFVNLSQLFSISNGILTDFKITEIDDFKNLLDVISQIVALVNSNQPEILAKILKQRFDETHLAIPETKIALLHGIHDSIERPIFQIFDLSHEIEVLAMNRKMIKVKRMLLLISPPDVTDYAAYLLSKISSSIIETKLYTAIYNSGNYVVISELLRQIISEAIRKYDE